MARATALLPARPQRARLAAASVLAAAVSLVAITRTNPIETSSGATFLVLLNAAILLAALPGTLVPGWSATGRLILWNASGWSLLLLVGGIFSFGYLMLPPLLLIVAGLIAWPRPEGQPFVTWPEILAHLGGFAALTIAFVLASLVR